MRRKSFIIIRIPHVLCRYVEHDTLIWEYLNSSIHLAPYLEKKFRRIYNGEAYKFYRQRSLILIIINGSLPTIFVSDMVILNNALDLEKSASDMSLKSSLKYFDSITLYMTQLRGALGELRDDIL